MKLNERPSWGQFRLSEAMKVCLRGETSTRDMESTKGIK